MSKKTLSAPSYAEPVIGFRSRKAAQLCAWFAMRAGGCIEKLKLIKLVYLTERSHLETYEDSMLLDELYSLPHGPICSSTLNGINGIIHKEIWDEYLARNGNLVVALKSVNRTDVDDLSDADLEIADTIWLRFQRMSASQIRNYTHDNCPEYTDLTEGRMPIFYKDVLRAIGSENSELVDRDVISLRTAEMNITQSAQ